jgi:hypothetical protein
MPEGPPPRVGLTVRDEFAEADDIIIIMVAGPTARRADNGCDPCALTLALCGPDELAPVAPPTAGRCTPPLKPWPISALAYASRRPAAERERWRPCFGEGTEGAVGTGPDGGAELGLKFDGTAAAADDDRESSTGLHPRALEDPCALSAPTRPPARFGAAEPTRGRVMGTAARPVTPTPRSGSKPSSTDCCCTRS